MNFTFKCYLCNLHTNEIINVTINNRDYVLCYDCDLAINKCDLKVIDSRRKLNRNTEIQEINKLLNV